MTVRRRLTFARALSVPVSMPHTRRGDKEQDVKISPWYTAMVTPSAVLSDEHTYIKTIIE